MNNNKNNIRIILFILGIGLFLSMFLLLSINKVSYFDNTVYSIISSVQCEPITMICKFLSFLCSTYFLICVMLLIVILAKDKKKAFYICLNIGLCSLLNQILKFIIQRNRPVDINLVVEGGYSFPSGHSMVCFAFYGFIIYLINKNEIKNKLVYSILLGTLILLIGLSRIYLGVHFASDVVAGFAMALTYLMIYIYEYEKRIT